MDVKPFAALAEEDRRLVEAARSTRENAYAPYSDFLVGAASRSLKGAIHVGANMENASYGLTICAEVVSLGRCVSEGDFAVEAIAVVGGPRTGPPAGPVTPCGRCRQLILEAGHVSRQDVRVLSCSSDLEQIRVATISQLLPFGFGPADLR